MAASPCSRGNLVLLLFIMRTLSICDGAGLSKQFLAPNNRAAEDSLNHLEMDSWNSAVPTYALNWAHHQGTTADLEAADGIYWENDFLASWAAAQSVLESDEGIDVTNEETIVFKSNACAPDRDCTHYEQVGYVFNSMTL